MRLDTETILVRLLGGSDDSYRPVQARRTSANFFRIVSEPTEMEKWQFKPGDVVRCAWRYSGDGNDGGIVAISLADSKLPKFAVGDRVLVSRHGGWKRDCLGTVVAGPEQTETLYAPQAYTCCSGCHGQLV